VTGDSVAAGLVDALLLFAEREGANREKLMVSAGIEERALADADNRIALNHYVRLMRAAIMQTGDPAFALHFGAAADLEEISIVGLIGRASRTMPEALMQINRYGRLVISVDLAGRARFSNIVDADGIWLTDHRADPNAFPELTEVTFARMINGVRGFAPQLKVHAVQVTHDAPAYERLLGAPVHFGAKRNAYRIDQDWLSLELNLEPRYVFAALCSHADTLLKDLESPESLIKRVEATILPCLHTGEANIERIAAGLGMSRQTLYRRLRAEGSSFEHVLGALRHRLALDYLSTRKVSVNETAYLLGFSDPAAFSRAFKRWTGKPPRQFRG
jgi:AraC-like DNA-binding protein